MRRTRLLTIAAAILGTIAGATALTASAQAATGDGYFEIINDHARKCADVAGNANYINGSVIEWDCHSGPNQLWQPRPFSNGSFTLVELHDPFGGGGNYALRMCLSVRGGGNNDDAVVQNLCDPTVPPGQQWRWQANGFGQWLVNGYGRCMALSPNTSANGTGIVLGDCSDTTAKYWHFA